MELSQIDNGWRCSADCKPRVLVPVLARVHLRRLELLHAVLRELRLFRVWHIQSPQRARELAAATSDPTRWPHYIEPFSIRSLLHRGHGWRRGRSRGRRRLER